MPQCSWSGNSNDFIEFLIKCCSVLQINFSCWTPPNIYFKIHHKLTCLSCTKQQYFNNNGVCFPGHFTIWKNIAPHHIQIQYLILKNEDIVPDLLSGWAGDHMPHGWSAAGWVWVWPTALCIITSPSLSLHFPVCLHCSTIK